MKQIFIFLSMCVLLGCSSDSDENVEPVQEPPETSTKYFSLYGTGGLNQFNVFHFKPDGTVKEYDYEKGNMAVPVTDGDEILVSCKVGEEVIPQVNYKVRTLEGADENITQSGILYTQPNSQSEFGFRILKTADGQDRIKIKN